MLFLLRHWYLFLIRVGEIVDSDRLMAFGADGLAVADHYIRERR